MAACDADPPDEPFLARHQRGVERAAGAERLVPFDRVRERVKLPEVDVVHAEAVERALELVARAFLVSPACLGGQEEPSGLVLEPRRDAELGVSIRGGDVDVVDSVLEERLEGLVGDALGDAAEGGRAEDDPGALVAGAAELGLRDHLPSRNGMTAAESAG